MTAPVPDLAAARPPSEFRVAGPTLAATVPTTMLLVDYALNGNAMPAPEWGALAESLPADLVDRSRVVRASLAHGTVLRSVLMHQLPAGHPGHLEWPALRSVIAGWSDAYVLAVIDFGVGANLRYLDPTIPPGPSAAELAPIAEPGDTTRKHGVRVLESWPVPEAADRAAELLDPRSYRATLLDLLDAIWDGRLGADWQAGLPALRAAVASPPAPPPGCTPGQWISLISGMRPDPSYAEAADRASELIMIPTPGLGRSLSLFADRQTWVLFTPHDRTETGDHDRTGISVNRLGQLAPVLTALGDRTRLAIVLQLLDHGPLTMSELADALAVHQSTVSRQVNALRRAELVTVRDRQVRARPEMLRGAAETLLATLD